MAGHRCIVYLVSPSTAGFLCESSDLEKKKRGGLLSFEIFLLITSVPGTSTIGHLLFYSLFVFQFGTEDRKEECYILSQNGG